MRKLILTLAILAMVISASNTMVRAGGSGFSIEFQERWKAVQAQEKAEAEGFAKIEREAARDLSTGMRGVPAQAGGTKATPSTGKLSW